MYQSNANANITHANAPNAIAVTSMTSKEIADLTGKRHDHVMRDIRSMLDQLALTLELTGPRFGGSYQDSTGRALPMFILPKDLTMTLVSGYNVVMRHRIVTRWETLESYLTAPDIEQPAVPLPEVDT